MKALLSRIFVLAVILLSASCSSLAIKPPTATPEPETVAVACATHVLTAGVTNLPDSKDSAGLKISQSLSSASEDVTITEGSTFTITYTSSDSRFEAWFNFQSEEPFEIFKTDSYWGDVIFHSDTFSKPMMPISRESRTLQPHEVEPAFGQLSLKKATKPVNLRLIPSGYVENTDYTITAWVLVCPK